MKKIFYVTVLFLASIVSSSAVESAGVPSGKISNIIAEYGQCDGFDTIRIGNLATTMLRGLIGANAEGDKDARSALSLFKGIKKISIVDYECAAPADRAAFNYDVERALARTDVLMETKDEDGVMRIYGQYDETSNRVSDFILFCPEDCTLILLKGTISMEKLGKIR